MNSSMKRSNGMCTHTAPKQPMSPGKTTQGTRHREGAHIAVHAGKLHGTPATAVRVGAGSRRCAFPLESDYVKALQVCKWVVRQQLALSQPGNFASQHMQPYLADALGALSGTGGGHFDPRQQGLRRAAGASG